MTHPTYPEVIANHSLDSRAAAAPPPRAAAAPSPLHLASVRRVMGALSQLEASTSGCIYRSPCSVVGQGRMTGLA